MKKILLLTFFAFFSSLIHSQSEQDYIFPLEAEVLQTPGPRIILTWDTLPGGNEPYYYFVYRSSNDGISYTNLSSFQEQTTFTDSAINTGYKYSYKVCRRPKSYGPIGFLYCNKIESAIELPEVYNRGGILLVATKKSYDSLPSQLSYYEQILQRDGWKTKRVVLPASATVASVKDSITNVYNNSSFGLKSIVLIGNVPVPYSGNIYPDGHPDHRGAWVADQYYADFAGTWTDNTVNNTAAARTANDNIPGDGKFDQDTVKPEIPIGRIDFSSLPKFPQSETTLLKKYLTKNIDFRKGLKQHRRRCIIKDSFGYGFDRNGISATTVVGFDSVFIDGNFRTKLLAESYLFSYGAGGGTYTSAGGITNTDNFVVDSLRTAFNMLFGSYFGDYDINDNLLRAAIASGSTLTTFWGGWIGLSFYRFGLGGTAGDNFLKRINAPYYCVIGDPSLTAFPFDTVPNVQLSQTNNEITISWQVCPTPNLAGYNVYRKKANENYYQKINPTRLTSTTYTDLANNKGNFIYMVRAVGLEKTASGTFYNHNLGTVSDTVNINTIVNTGYTASIHTCDVYISPGGKTWTTSGIHRDTVPNYLGNDSLITIYLTVGHPSSASHAVYHCGNTYLSPSGKYNWVTSGIYNDTIVNSSGCDSVLTINLTLDNIQQPVVIFNEVDACIYYISPSGKHIWTTTGTYFDTIPGVGTCDSIFITNLLIHHNEYVTKYELIYCDSSFVSPSGMHTWTTSGKYTEIIPTTHGCDSIITFHIEFFSDTTVYISGYVDCLNGYTSPSGKTWFNPGNHQDTLPSSTGCDTLFNIWLYNYTQIYVTSFCDPSFAYHSPSGKYTWTVGGTYMDTLTSSTGCDSILRISIYTYSVLSGSIQDTISCGGSYLSPSGKYIWTTPGYYRDTLVSANGCDSILMFSLSAESINSTITLSGDSLIANYYSGASYQWLDCNNNFAAVTGATQRKFAPSVNGNYAVAINKNGCTDTSLCKFYTLVSVPTLNTLSGNELLVFPNPTQGYITVKTRSVELSNANIEIYNSIGQLISDNTLTGNETNILINTPPGLYFVRAKNNIKSTEFIKIIKVY